MAHQPIKVPYPDCAVVEVLEHLMRYQEIGWSAVTEISVENNATYAVHDRNNDVALNSLILKEDPNENVAPPDGSTLICRGKAIIGGTTKKVAAFRQQAAAGFQGPSPPPPPAPPPPAAGGS